MKTITVVQLTAFFILSAMYFGSDQVPTKLYVAMCLILPFALAARYVKVKIK